MAHKNVHIWNCFLFIHRECKSHQINQLGPTMFVMLHSYTEAHIFNINHFWVQARQNLHLSMLSIYRWTIAKPFLSSFLSFFLLHYSYHVSHEFSQKFSNEWFGLESNWIFNTLCCQVNLMFWNYIWYKQNDSYIFQETLWFRSIFVVVNNVDILNGPKSIMNIKQAYII